MIRRYKRYYVLFFATFIWGTRKNRGPTVLVGTLERRTGSRRRNGYLSVQNQHRLKWYKLVVYKKLKAPSSHIIIAVQQRGSRIGMLEFHSSFDYRTIPMQSYLPKSVVSDLKGLNPVSKEIAGGYSRWHCLEAASNWLMRATYANRL